MSSLDGQGNIYIDPEAWHEFLVKHAPFLKNAEYSINPQVRYDGDGSLIVEYAFSDDCHPNTWSNPPHWLRKEKK